MGGSVCASKNPIACHKGDEPCLCCFFVLNYAEWADAVRVSLRPGLPFRATSTSISQQYASHPPFRRDSQSISEAFCFFNLWSQRCRYGSAGLECAGLDWTGLGWARLG